MTAAVHSRNNRQRKAPGRLGTDIAMMANQITTLTGTATTLQPLGTPYPPAYSGGASGAYYLERLSITAVTAAVPASGAIVGTIKKARGGSSGTIIAMTGTFSLGTGFITATLSTFDIPLLSTLTQDEFAFLQGDALYLSTVADAGVTTQPAACINSDWAVGA